MVSAYEREELMKHVQRSVAVIAMPQVLGKGTPLPMTAEMDEVVSPGSMILR